MDKKKLFFINYLVWTPGTPSYRYKYELFSRWCNGTMMHLASRIAEVQAGDFRFFSYKYHSNIVRRQLGYVLHCLKEAWKVKPLDYIIAYDPGICGLIGLLVRAVAGGKLVIEVNTDHLFKRKEVRQGLSTRIAEAVKIALMRFTLPKADGIKFINQPITKSYREKFGLTGNVPKQITFYSYIATQMLTRTDRHDPYILLVGHPFDIKGVDVLIKAFQRISPRYPDITVKIIGHCPDIQPYKDLAAGNPNIVFHEGMPHVQVVSEFANCLFYVCASRTEGIPRVIVEAMTCAKAVIGTRAGGIPEVIEEGVTGLLFEPENDADLADKMLTLLNDPDARTKMGEAGAARAASCFSPENYVNIYRKFLDSLG